MCIGGYIECMWNMGDMSFLVSYVCEVMIVIKDMFYGSSRYMDRG